MWNTDRADDQIKAINKMEIDFLQVPAAFINAGIHKRTKMVQSTGKMWSLLPVSHGVVPQQPWKDAWRC